MRAIYRLSDTAVKAHVKKDRPGRFADGGNLYLQIGNGGASFIMRYAVPGVKIKRRGKAKPRIREMGLGSYADTSLAEARDRRDAARALLKDGKDPLSDKASKRAVIANAKTFGFFVENEFLESATAGFKNDKHKAQWESTLKTYCKPLWSMALNEITTNDVKAVLDPIWHTKKETARRLRGRVERVLAAAKVAGYREGENPARWRDNFQVVYGKQKASKKHHPAVPFVDMPDFMRDLRKLDSVSALALEFAILTAARTGEVRGARWAEIQGNAWTVPADRMKAEVEHKIPLTDRALEILKAMKRGKPDDLIFPGAKSGEPLSDAALLMCLRGLRDGVTTHGFRSSFKDWSMEIGKFPDWLSEMALAHTIKDKAKAAYHRGDALDLRREMMTAWESYLAR